jgi:hypothetical protein
MINKEYFLGHFDKLKIRLDALKREGEDTKTLVKHYKFVGPPVSDPTGCVTYNRGGKRNRRAQS